MDVERLGYTDEQLEEAPARAARLLQGIGAVPTVRTALTEAGMTDADIEEGRTLLLACLASPVPGVDARNTEQAKAQRAAELELDAWDEPNFARYDAALRRNFPAAHAYVFKDLRASSGPNAVRGVATFLSRLAALKDGTDPNRAGSERKDREAVLMLESRGLTSEERARLRALVDVALGPGERRDARPSVDAPRPPEPPAASGSYTRNLAELLAWYDEWATTARAVVKKRDYLGRLGLAPRRAPKRAAEPASSDG